MPSFRALPAFASLLAASVLVSINGCDNASGKADKQIQQSIAEAIPHMNGSDDDRGKAESVLLTASSQTDASAAPRMNLQELRAQLELRDARALQPKIDKQQAEILHLLWDIRQLALQMQASNQLAAALSMYEPSKVQASLTKGISDVQGSPDHPLWIKTDTGGVPSLAGITAKEAALQTQIGELQTTIKSLSDQRAAALAQADQLNQESEKAKGDKAVDLYRQGAEARKRSDELSVQGDENNLKLARAQADLAIAQGQEQVLNAALKDIGGKADQTAGVWKTIQEQIENQKVQAKAILGDSSQASVDPNDPTGGSTITSKTALLDQKIKALRGLRQDAETHLNSAIEFFRDAGQLADTLQSTLQTQLSDPKTMNRPDADALRDEAVTMHSARYKLQEASALDYRATVAAARASDAVAVQQLAAALKPILDEAQQPMPGALADADNKLADDVKTGRQLADESYASADELLDTASQGSGSEAQKRAARIASIYTQYGWYLLSSSVGDKVASAHLDKAKAQRDESIQNGVELKNLPPELIAAAAPATPAPR